MAAPAHSSPTLPTLPGHYYHDPAIYAAEQDRIFGRRWVCVGHHDRIPQPGDYFTVELGGENILVLRGQDSAVRAFLNACRHRGARLCNAPCGQIKGTLRCQYHAWSYALDGRLVGVPNMADETGFDRADYGLLPVHLEVWEGLLFVNLSEGAPPSFVAQVTDAVVERFGDDTLFRRYRLNELQIARTIEYSVAANWKIGIENFLECYHCAPMHPELCDLLPGFRGGRAYQQGVGTAFAPGVTGFTLHGQASRPALPDLTPDDQQRYYGLVFMPGAFVNLLPDHVVLHTITPLGPEQMQIRCDWLFAPATIARPDFAPEDTVDLFDLVNRQDWAVCELTQRGMHSRAHRHGGLFVPLEHHIRTFNDTVLREIGEL